MEKKFTNKNTTFDRVKIKLSAAAHYLKQSACMCVHVRVHTCGCVFLSGYRGNSAEVDTGTVKARITLFAGFFMVF